MKKAKTVSKKFIGTIHWARVNEGDIQEVQLPRVTLGSTGIIKFDFRASDYHYAVTMSRTTEADYELSYDRRHVASMDHGKGDASLYWNDHGHFIFGHWVEDGTNYPFWAKLTEVEHFADESK